MPRKAGKPNRSPKRTIIGLLVILVLLASLIFYFSTRHYQIRYVVRRYMYYEQSGDFGSSWNMLHSIAKSKMDQATYVKTKSQIYLADLKATSYHYRIKHIRHLNTWHPTHSITLHDVFRVTLDESFNSQFGKKIMISTLYLSRDKKDRNRWCILWEMNSGG